MTGVLLFVQIDEDYLLSPFVFVTWKEIQLLRGYVFTLRIRNDLASVYISREKVMKWFR